MRDSHKKSSFNQLNRHQAMVSHKRRWLAAFLVVTTTSSASIAFGGNDRPLLPLPAAVGSSDHVKVNPFCLPEHEGYHQNVALASNGPRPAVRFKKIGAAIGLHSIEKGEMPRRTGRQMLIEEVGEGSIQSNPFESNPVVDGTSPALSTHPITKQVAATDEVAREDPSGKTAKRSSKIVLMPLFSAPSEMQKHTVPQEDVVASDAREDFASVAPSFETDQPLVDPPVNPSSDSTDSSSSSPTGGLADYLAEDLSLEEMHEPITFSLSDQTSSSDQGPLEETESSSQDPSSLLAEAQPSVEERVSVPAEVVSIIQAAEPLQESVETMANALPMDAIPPVQNNKFCEAIDPPMADEVDAQEHLHSKRYRPPVAIHPVPVIIEGLMTAPTFQVESIVDTTQQLATSPKEKQVSQAKVIPLYLNRAQVRSLTLGARLRSVEVADKNVCQAFAAGPNQLKLIGTGSGVTRLVIWADPVKGQSAPRVRAFDIHVKETSQEKGESVEKKITMLNESIRDAFPSVDVVVHKQNGKILVSGRCSDNAIARKIVRMVRKTCLVAVEDELQVR